MSETPFRGITESTQMMQGSKRRFDVIVAGAGPTGLAAANVLAQAGHSVAIFERHAALYNLPRAGHLDNEVLRILQGIGCLDALMEDAFPIRSVPLLDGEGNFLLELVPDHQSASSFRSVMMYQPVLERALFDQLTQHDGPVSIHLGWTVDGLVEQGNGTIRTRARPTEPAGAQRANGADWTSFEAAYLIAADGSASAIREGAGIAREDFAISERWLDIDLRYRRARDFGPPAIIGDPRRPHFFSPLGKRHHRFECQLMPHEPTEAFSSPLKAWELLAQKGVTPADMEIVRQAVYTFEYRMAHRWRKGRLFLMGDAAHTMCPLLGQGLSSGIRDAANLGWKMDLVLSGLAAPSTLDSYETERRPHVTTWADLSVKAGEFICITDPEQARARDALIRGGAAPPLRPPPHLTAGLIDLSAGDAANALAGHAFPQRPVTLNGRSGLFDDLIGRGFALLTQDDARRVLSAEDRTWMERIGMRAVRLNGWPEDPSVLTDPTGDYYAFMQNNALAAVIVRPDRYVFGAVRSFDALSGMLARLRQLLAPS